MPTTYVPVTPGIDMTQALGGSRLTKTWLRDYLRVFPQKDFRNLGPGGSYVNGQEAVDGDLTFQVYDAKRPGTTIAMVYFQRTTDNSWGYQAVVR